jgi:hypothetical protein
VGVNSAYFIPGLSALAPSDSIPGRLFISINRRRPMFWIPIFAVPTALALIKLGALSVWVQVLSAALVCAAAVIVAGLAWGLIRRFWRM